MNQQDPNANASAVTHTAGWIALAVGGAGSVALTLFAGHRIGAPVVVQVLFAGWVALPFVILAAALWASSRRSAATRLVLSRAAVVVAVASLAVYTFASLATSRAATPVFVLVAPLSVLLVGVVVPALVVMGGRHS